MKEKEGVGLWKRVLGSRWFSGFVTALFLVGSFTAAGLVFGNPAATQAATNAGPPMAIRMVIVDERLEPQRKVSDLLSFEWGISREGPVEPGTDKVNVQDVSITKYLDGSSADLSKVCCKADFLREVRIDLCKATCSDKSSYLLYNMEDVIVSSYSVSGDSEDTLPVEKVTLSFTKIEWTYVSQDRQGQDDTQVVVCPGWTRDCTRK